MTRRTPRALDQALRDSTLQLLFRCARLANQAAMARVNRKAVRPVFRQAIANLLPHVTFDGVRLGALADKLEISKQAVSKVVAELAEQGIVEVVPDPDDARGRLVRFTARGAEALHQGLDVLRGLERELTESVGARRMTALHDALTALLARLEVGEAARD